MTDKIPYAPTGTVAMPRYEWLDEKTGRPLNKQERAVAFIRDYHARTGEWPAIKVIMSNAGVGQGTAWRARRQN